MHRATINTVSQRIVSSFIFFIALSFVFFYDNQSALAACEYPAQVLDLNNWKETLPTGSSGKPTEVKQPALRTHTTNPYFRANADCSGVIFRAPVDGVTTSGSGYPRSELREMMGGGKQLASWSTTEGTHTLFLEAAVTALPQSKSHIVVGQVHDAEDDVIVVRLEYPKLFVDINGETGPVLDAKYTLGKKFTAKFVARNGQIAIYYNGSESPAYVLKKKSAGNYFKVGAYTQSNCSKEKKCDSSNFGEVNIYRLLVSHADAGLSGVVGAPAVETVADTIAVSSASAPAPVSPLAPEPATDPVVVPSADVPTESAVEPVVAPQQDAAPAPLPETEVVLTRTPTMLSSIAAWFKSVALFASATLKSSANFF